MSMRIIQVGLLWCIVKRQSEWQPCVVDDDVVVSGPLPDAVDNDEWCLSGAGVIAVCPAHKAQP